jgi:uncharacterized protein YbjT (DUF2867 family)
MRVLVTGATGYIGGRLIPALLDAGHDVRCLARNPHRLDDQPWRDEVDVARGDLLDPAGLDAAFDGIDAVYYLVHSMDGSGSFADRDRLAAENTRRAAESAGVGRIVYLGGLGDEDEDLSAHLSSRHEVGRTLAAGSVPVTELRAAIIIGSGSVSFEMLRHLTEVLPVMTTPSWVRTRCQPVAIRDVLDLLVLALGDDAVGHHVLEVGGPDVLTYEEMMQAYAEVAGLRRRVIIPVPVLSPALSSGWVGLVTPIPMGVARPLIDSLRNEVVVRGEDATMALGGNPPTSYRDAVRRALDKTQRHVIETRWSDAVNHPAEPLPTDPEWAGQPRMIDRREVETTARADDLFWAVSRIGGDVGYYTMDWTWSLRGLADRAIGGVGLRRGRRHPSEVRIGEAVDFWRVAEVDPPNRLLLRAEMIVPGEAFLEWAITDHGHTRVLTQTATFYPRGLWGRLYWLALVPFHVLIFGRMARRIAAVAAGRGLGGRPVTTL